MRQHELAKEIGITQPSISRIESGECQPKYEHAKKLAEVTNKDVEFWMEASPEEKRKAREETPSLLGKLFKRKKKEKK